MKINFSHILLLLLIAFCFERGIRPAWTRVHSDFGNYYVSAKLVSEGESLEKLYDNEWFQQKITQYGLNTQGKFAPFPPLTSWLMLPLTSVEALTAQRIFTVINLLFMIGGIFLLKEITHWKFHECALLMLVGGSSIVNNISFGQFYLIMTVTTLGAILLADRNHPLIAGSLLAIFISIKYFPIVLLAGYFLNSILQRKNEQKPNFFSSDMQVLLSSFILITGIIFCEFIFFGSPVMNEFFYSTFIPHLDGQLNGQGSYSLYFQSWESFFKTLFVRDPVYNPNNFIDWPAGKTIFKILVYLTFASFAILVITRFRNTNSEIRRPVFLSVLSVTALVLLPASATYHFALLLIPLSLIIGSNLIERRLINVSIALYGIIGFLPMGLAFDLGDRWGIFFAYPRLWLMCALFFVITFGLMKNKALNSHS